MSADLAQPIRAALVGTPAVTTLLEAYKGSFPIFTRRPVPDDAPSRVVVVSPDIASNDEDGVADQRPVVQRDVAVYGRNEPAAEYRAVEALAREVHALFHRQRNSITVSGWHVVDVQARWPLPAPTDDEQTVGRVVPLTIRLARQN